MEGRFEGRDWRTIQAHEIINPEDVKFVEVDTNVETATEVLISSGPPNVVLIRENNRSKTAVSTFTYSDLNAYLLLVVGLSKPEEGSQRSFNELAKKGRNGQPIPLQDVKNLWKKEPLVTIPHTCDLTKVIEVFGGGIHRIVVVKEGTSEVMGLLSQGALMGFFWENRKNFPMIESLYAQKLKDLRVGSGSVWAINGEKPLTDALELMNLEGITSLPVLDNQKNVVGNISHVDVKLLTKSTSLPLLYRSCLHFISCILSERGLDDGKDSVPVFHVSPYSSLGHTVAKLVATRSHRMWIVESPSPNSSGSATPASGATHPPLSPSHASLNNPTFSYPASHNANDPPPPSPGLTSSSNPFGLSGHLTGVVSLTDILNLFAKASGLAPADPSEARKHRRKSSNTSIRRSEDNAQDRRLSLAEIVGADAANLKKLG